DVLRDKMDYYLAGEYGIQSRNNKYEKWRESHQPFHWFIEFYGIMHNSGFDVIIGNPPYVEYSKVKRIFSLKLLGDEEFSNLYAYVWKRCLSLTRSGKLGMIVPVASVCTDGYSHLQRLFINSGR